MIARLNTDIRYQDDVIILCKTKRQLSRCRRRMMKILHERCLTLSRKKSRIGCIKKGFHFLGIDYPGTQTQDNTNVAHSSNDSAMHFTAYYLPSQGGGKSNIEYHQNGPIRIAPHPRTLRLAREQIRAMVFDGASTQRIRNYLRRWATWWVSTSETWQYDELLTWFLDACYDAGLAAYAAGLLQKHINGEKKSAPQSVLVASL